MEFSLLGNKHFLDVFARLQPCKLFSAAIKSKDLYVKVTVEQYLSIITIKGYERSL